MHIENFLLFAYFLVYFLMGFVVRSYLVYYRTGINPLVLPRTQDAYGYVGMAFKVLIVICFAVVLILAVKPEACVWFGSITLLQLAPVHFFGWACLMDWGSSIMVALTLDCMTVNSNDEGLHDDSTRTSY